MSAERLMGGDRRSRRGPVMVELVRPAWEGCPGQILLDDVT
jgi:hypothetical protein